MCNAVIWCVTSIQKKKLTISFITPPSIPLIPLFTEKEKISNERWVV